MVTWSIIDDRNVVFFFGYSYIHWANQIESRKPSFNPQSLDFAWLMCDCVSSERFTFLFITDYLYYKIERIHSTNHITVKIMTLIGRNKSSQLSGWKKFRLKKCCVCRIVWAKNKKKSMDIPLCVLWSIQHIAYCVIWHRLQF